jgi:drug/metabolite transporter (DMT)-like permease
MPLESNATSRFFDLRKAVGLYLLGMCLMTAMFVLNDKTKRRYGDLVFYFFIGGHGVLGLCVMLWRIRRQFILRREWLDMLVILFVIVCAFWVGPLTFLWESRKLCKGKKWLGKEHKGS